MPKRIIYEDRDAAELFKKWKAKMMEKVVKSNVPKTSVSDIAKKYWVAKTFVMGSNLKENGRLIQLELGTKVIDLNELNAFRITCVKIRDSFNRIKKNFDELSVSDCKLYEFLNDTDIEVESHSYVMMTHTSDVIKACQCSSRLLMPLLTRIDDVLVEFIKRAISDAMKDFKCVEKTSLHYQSSLLWMNDVSKDLDPESTEKMQKFKIVQKYVKDMRQCLNDQKILASDKFALLKSSLKLIFTKELCLYFQQLVAHFKKCRDEYSRHIKEFSGLPFYKYSVLEPVLGPDNGVSSVLLDKYIAPQVNLDESYLEFAKSLSTVDNSDLISLEDLSDEDQTPVFVSLKNMDEKSESIICIAEESESDENGTSITDTNLIEFDKKKLQMENDDQIEAGNEKQQGTNSSQMKKSASNDNISFFDIEIDDLIRNNNSQQENSSYFDKNSKGYQELQDLMNEIDSLENKNETHSILNKC